MSLANFIAIRRLATSTIRAAILSPEYRSGDLWKARFQCPIVNNNELIKMINNKILANDTLSNLELDVFINVSSPSTEYRDQLREAARLLSGFRKTLMAHRLLPSTPHAVCRLFLDSAAIPSLVTMLDDRVKYGVFPDSFATNLILDAAIESKQYALAAKIASLVMLQEEFGLNHITDKLSLLSLSQYLDAKTDFQDWPQCDSSQDPVLIEKSGDDEYQTGDAEDEPKAEKKEEPEDDEEDEDDAEYIRVPFLRNPYFDNHFDIKNPRVICGKSLTSLGRTLEASNVDLSRRAHLLGSILQGSWDEAVDEAKRCKASKIKMGPSKETLLHYIENLNDLEALEGEKKQQLSESVNALSAEGPSLSDLARKECDDLKELETSDINELKSNISAWSEMREETRQAELNRIRRNQLRAEIEAKKDELKRKEDYLYYYDRLKQSKLTRIEYK